MTLSKRTRILLVAPPFYGHLFPLVPLAWALRAAGHDVLVATCGIAVNAAIRAGLSTVDVANGVDLPSLLRRHKTGFSRAFPPVAPTDGGETPSVFTELCDVMADGAVMAADGWRADLIVYTPEAGAALIAASRCQVPALCVSIGLSHTPEMMADRYAEMATVCERHKVATLASSAAWIDLSPPSLRQRACGGWPMRYMQYNGGQRLAVEPGSSRPPRIAVTLGTMVPLVFGLGVLRGIVDAARQIDATFVIAHGADNSRELGPLPPNVEVHGWLALDTLIERSDAAIHHGGFGTALGMLTAGLPQLLLPQGSDQFHNADVLKRRGAALVFGELETADAVQRLLDDAALRDAAREVSSEIAAMPPPADVVPKMIALVH